MRKFDIKHIHLPTLPIYCSHFTWGNRKKSFFSAVLVIHTSDFLAHSVYSANYGV